MLRIIYFYFFFLYPLKQRANRAIWQGWGNSDYLFLILTMKSSLFSILQQKRFNLDSANIFFKLIIYLTEHSPLMGIDGLLKHLKKCMQEKNLQEYRGKRAAVDTYAWLHKIIKGPSGKQIITGKDQKKYVNDCLRRIDKISKVDIQLILVFDGGPLPGKMKQQQIRRKRREQNLQIGKQLMLKGNTELGLKKMIDSIDVSPDIAYKLIEELKNRNIKFIVAPYQADAQLAYLSRTGIVDIIITEDSDLLAFGAKKILYKLDFSTLNGEQICLENIKNEPEASFGYFSHNMFLSTCIMAGCDYLPQIKGVGMKLAQKVISRNTTLKKALAQLSQGKQIPENYQDNFLKAMLTFRFQRVYCPKSKKCVSVNQMETSKWRQIKQLNKCLLWSEEVLDPQTLEFALKLSVDQNHPDWQFLGKKLSNEMARKIAEGEINPITFEAYDKRCLEKLKTQHQGLTLKTKRSTYSVKQSNGQTLLMPMLRPLQKKNPLEYKHKSRSINEEQYKVFQSEERKGNFFEVREISKVENKKLRFNDDSDSNQQESKQQVEIASANNSAVELVSSGQSPICFSAIEIGSVETKSEKQQGQFRNKLQKISETMFSKIFSDQFLQSPFSY